MTRRDMFKELFERCNPRLAALSEDMLPTSGRLRLIQEDMFMYPGSYEAADIRKVRCILRFVNKVGYW